MLTEMHSEARLVGFQGGTKAVKGTECSRYDILTMRVFSACPKNLSKSEFKSNGVICFFPDR